MRLRLGSVLALGVQRASLRRRSGVSGLRAALTVLVVASAGVFALAAAPAGGIPIPGGLPTPPSGVYVVNDASNERPVGQA